MDGALVGVMFKKKKRDMSGLLYVTRIFQALPCVYCAASEVHPIS